MNEWMLLMFIIGLALVPASAYWDEWSTFKRGCFVTWVVIWLVPPLAAVWVRGVLG